VNLWALTEVTAAVLPGMEARRRGDIVNIGSGSTEAIPSSPLYTIYAALCQKTLSVTRVEGFQ